MFNIVRTTSMPACLHEITEAFGDILSFLYVNFNEFEDSYKQIYEEKKVALYLLLFGYLVQYHPETNLMQFDNQSLKEKVQDNQEKFDQMKKKHAKEKQRS